MSGSSGFIGSALVRELAAEGYEVIRLVRTSSSSGAQGVRWDPEAGTVDRRDLEGMAAVVHLAGENIAGGRWTARRKARIRDSRVRGTRLLCDSLLRADRRPETLICASGIDYYGDRGAVLLREDSPPGDGFLAEVCREWEAAACSAARGGIRVVALRFGMVLDAGGGALSRLIPAFRAGVGGRIGDGKQYMSWIALPDVVAVIRHVLATDSLEGPVNAVAPHPVTNREFARALGRALGRPAVVPLPAVAARLLFGEMADALLLASHRAEPAALLRSGYRFLHPELEEALRALVGTRS